MNPRVIIATIAVAVATFLFSLVAPPLLSLIPTDTAHAQQTGPKVAIEFDPGHTVRDDEELHFTLSFTGLPSGETNLTYDVDVVTFGETELPLCEGAQDVVNSALGSYSGTTATATGTIPVTCPPRNYILVVTLKDGSDDLTRTASAFRVQEYRVWDLPGTQPTSPAGLWGEYHNEVIDGEQHIYNLLHVVDSASRLVYVYKLQDRSDGRREHALTFVETYSLAGTSNPWGIVANASTTWVANDGSGSGDEVFAYSNADRSQRVSVDEFTLDSANSDPRGIDENTLNDVSGSIFVVDVNGGDAGKVFQYSRENSGPYVHSSTSSKVFDLHDDNENPTGLFFNSYTMFVADDEDDKVYAYEDRHQLDGGWVNVPGKEINGLGRLGNNDPAGVWVDYRWVYVVDSVTKKIYGYNYPDIPFDPIAISGSSSIAIRENSTTTGALYEAMDPNERYYENATTSWANLGIHRTHTDDRLFDFEKVGDISSTTAEFELVFREPGANYEKPIDSDENNDYELLISGSGRGFPYAYFPLTVHITDQEPEPPFFWENSTTRQVLEDTPSGQPMYPAVEAINPDNDAVHIYSLKGADAADFTIDASTGLLSTNKILEFAETPYSVIVGIRDGVDGAGDPTNSTDDDDTINVTINVFRGPEVTGESSIDYTENGTGDVAQYSATNLGNGTIVWSLQGNDADDFVINENNGTLLFGSPPDYEGATDSNTDNVYNVTIVASDGSVEGELDVTVTVTNLNEKPEFTEGSSTSRNVDEGDQADRPVGNPVTATEQDAGDTLTYSLGGTDASSFDIDTSTGQIKTNAPLDFDGGQKTYEVTVEVRDSRDADGNSDTGTDDSIDVTINVQGVNDPPVLTGTSTINYLENGSGPVGTYTATDPEGQATIVWGLSGDDEDEFSISSGVLSFVTPPDYEEDTHFFVIVEASDGSSTSSLPVNVYIDPVDETPVVTGDISPELAENTSGNVATYEDGDPEQGSITWSLAGDDADAMAISSGGDLTFNSPPDHESKDAYNVTVQAFDGNSTGTLPVVVTVTDVNEDPEFPMATTSRSVEENAGLNAEVGLPVEADDPDVGDTLTYSLSGADASLFSIDADGQITAKSSLDSDVRATYEVTAEVHDGKAADGSASTAIDDTVVVTIMVSDINEPPTLTGTTTVSIAENPGTTVATYSADDPEGISPMWDLLGDDADDFDITGGVLTFKAMPDHEAPTDADTDSVYHVTVKASDGNNTVPLNVTVTVTDVNEAPAFPSTEDGQRSVVENTISGQPVGDPVAAVDPDQDAVLTYILGGTDASSFDINSTSGQILTKDDLDEDTKASYTVIVSVHDGKADDGSASTSTDDSVTVYITVTGINEPPEITGATAIDYAENDTSPVATYTVTDPEHDQVTLALSGTDEDDFTITQSGVLTFASDPDFETPTDDGGNNTYNLNVLAGDGTSTTTHAVTVTVTNVNEPPAFPDSETGQRSVEENTAADQPIGAPLKATDPDHGDTLTYSLSGNDAGSFDINQLTGQILTKDPLDADTKANYVVVVLVHDGKADDGSESTSVDDQVAVSITVTDINEPPTVTGTTSTEFAENDTSSVEHYLYDDQEADRVTWSLSGVDEDDFSISQSGELEFASSPDYEDPTDSNRQNDYVVNVLVADGTSTTTYPVSVFVTNVNERAAFPDTEDGQRSVKENTAAGTNIGDPVRAIDPDSGDTLTYTLDISSAEFFDIDESTGQLKTKADLNAEELDTYTVFVDVHDGKDDDGSVSTTSDAYIQVTITVSNVNEPPVVSGDEAPEVIENVELYVGIYFADDPENSTTSTWTLDGVDKDAFEISDSGELSFLAVPDYEGKSEYSVTVQNSDGLLTGKLAVTITVIDVDEGGEIELSSEQPQVGTLLTATLEDDDGSLSNIAWKWESYSATTTTWTTVSTTTAGNATSNAYTPTADDEGNTLLITATYTDGHGTGKSVEEQPNNNVRPAPPINYPPAFASSTVSRSIAENTAGGENIGEPVTADDRNSGDILSYALEGPDADSFDIDSGSGQLKTKAALNYEDDATYTVLVRASDPSNTSDTISVTINVTNVNEGPDISGSHSLTFTEGLLSVVGTFSHNDPEGENIVWSLGTILDEDYFTITNGILRFTAPPDKENPTDADQDNVYYVLVKVTDGEFNDELPVTVVVIGTNEGPEFPSSTTSRDVSENTSAGQNVGVPVSATDPERDSLTYSLAGTDASHFDIATSTGQILTKSDLDYESTKKTYTVTVSVTDSKNADGAPNSVEDATIEVTINVINEDEAPVLTGATNTKATENATGTIATYSAPDPEGATTTFTVHGDSSDFSITKHGGVLSIDSAPDFENQSVYQIKVRASDGQNISELDVTVNVTNEDEPGLVTLSPTSPEVSTQVSASVTDPDRIASAITWTWHRSENTDSGWSLISGVTGSNYTPGNADEGNYLRATASYDDGEGAGKEAHGVSDSKVPETNSQPSFSPNIVREVNENTPSGQDIGDPVKATDDENDALKYSLGGDDADHFDISTTTGQLMTKGDLDFEEKPSYSVEVSVSDGKDVDNNPDDSTDATIPVTINVKNVNEAPELAGPENVDFDENDTTEVATYEATDPEDDSISWDLSGTDRNSFDIATGTLTFKSPPDFENQSTYNVTVVASDGPNNDTLTVTVSINNLDEDGSVTLSSEQPQRDAQLTATLSDPDETISELTWSWVAGTSTVRTATSSSGNTDSYTPVDADVGKAITVTVSYTDILGSGKSASVTSANQVRQPPVVHHAPAYQSQTAERFVPENSGTGANIGDPITATDQNSDDVLNYKLGGPDSASFDLDSSSGQLMTKSELDHEDKDTYTVTVTATDPSNLEATITVTITVTDVNEPPTLSGNNSLTYPENNTGSVGTFTVTDPEGGDVTLRPEGVDGSHFRFSGNALEFNAQPNFETPLDDDNNNIYHVTVVADDKNSTTTLPIVVTVTNVNEPPQFPNGDTGTRSVTENTAAGQNVGAPVAASDPEKDDLTYTLSGTDAGHFEVSATTGQILAKSELDYEGRKSYSVTVSVRDSKNVDGNPDAVTDDEIDITINVIGENEAPVITGATSTNFAENGTRAVASYTGRDPEGGSVYWTVLGTDSAYFAITDSGVLSFDPAPDFEDPDDSDRNNVYHVTVQASDGNNINRLDMTVTVTNVEEPGEVELSSVQPQVDTALTATLDDPDGVESTITWSWQRSRAGSKSSWSTISGATSDSYTPVTGDVGRYLRATASYDDGYSTGKSASAVSENTVRALPENNDPPRFLSSFERRSVDENTAPGQNVGDPVTAIDDPADNLTYWLDGTNAGMFSIVRSTGQIQTRMPLDYESNSSYRVTVVAADPSSATTSVPVTITVVNVDEAPVAVGDTATATEDGAAVSIDVLANDSDPEGMQLSLTAVTQPVNGSASIVGTNVEYTPNAGYYGSDAFTYTVSDVNSNSSFGNVTISVAADSDPTVQTDTIAIQFVPIDGGGERILLSDYFSDPDEGHPPYLATSSDDTIFTVEVSEGYLTITPVGIGVATTTLTVSDSPAISQEFRVVVYRPVVERTESETVFIVDPSIDTTLVSKNEVLSVLFQAGARDQFFQVAVDAQSNNCGIEAPIDHQHICVLVDLFDLGAQSIEESLNQNSTLHVTLNQALFDAIEADVASGDFQMWKGHGPTDVSWDQIDECPNPVGTDECYELTADPNGGGKITVHNIAGFSEFAAGSDQPSPPPTEPPTTTPPPTTGGGGGTGGGSGGSGSSGGGSSSGGSSSSSRYTRGNQTPQIFGQTNVTFNENSTDPVATYIAEDADDDDITWSLLGYDRSKFKLSQEGVLSFRSPPDYENPEGREGNTYRVILQAEDDGRPSEYDVHHVRVTVMQVNELGELSGNTELALPENNVAAIAQYDIEDPEKGTITWSLSGPDAEAFTIDEQGNLSPTAALDFENPGSSEGSNVHSLKITATDDGDPKLSADMDVSVAITNVNEAPLVDEIPGVNLDSDEQPWLVDLNMYFSDPDGDNLEYDFTGQNITNVALAHLVGGTLSIDPVSGGDVSFYVVATDSGDLSTVTSVSVSVTEPEPVPSPAPAVTVPVPVSTPAPAVVVPVPTPTVPETVIVEPEPVPTFAPLPPLVEQKIRNQTQETDPVSKVIVAFALEPVDEPMAEVSLPPATAPGPPQKVSQVDEDAAAGHSPAPLPASLDSSGGGITIWMIILLAMIAVATTGYGVRMFVIHRL